MSNLNGHWCPRCGQLLFKDGVDIYCLCCGFRLSFYNMTSLKDIRKIYNNAALIARLIYNHSGVLGDLNVCEMPGRGNERVRGFVNLSRLP